MTSAESDSETDTNSMKFYRQRVSMSVNTPYSFIQAISFSVSVSDSVSVSENIP